MLSIILQDENSADIQKFISAQLEEFPTVESKFGTILRERARGIFLWVDLVIEDIILQARQGDDVGMIETALKKVPDSLSGLYHSLFDRLKPQDKILSFRAFNFVSQSLGPISFSELNHAIHVDPCRP